MLISDNQRAKCDGFNDNYNFYGNVKSGTSAAGYKVTLDAMPEGEKDVLIKRNKLKVLPADSEEPLYDRQSDTPEDLAEIQNQQGKKKSPQNLSADTFKALDAETQASATV